MDIHLANAERAAEEAFALAMEPPPPVDYLAWAKANIIFGERESPLPGPYNEELFPYFSEILLALSPDDPCRIVSLMKSAQLGGTVLANIFTLGSLELVAGDFLYCHPTDDNARRWSRTKLQPMIRNTPSIRALIPERSRDGGDAVLYKERIDGRGSIIISGANSPASLSMISPQGQVQDDLAKWETNAAGNPETQADSRSRGREFAKIFKNSTPMVLPGCRITRNFRLGSQERFHVPCPHCGHEQALEWGNMLEHLDEEYPEKAHFTCVDCVCSIEEHHRPEMLRKGRWIAENPAAARYHRSFALWSAYSPLQSFETIAREWLKAKGDAGAEQTFLNDTVGLPYETKGEAPPWEELRDRAANSEYRAGEVPTGALVLTLGMDCQKDRVEWQLVGWGREFRRWTIDRGIIPGHISETDPKGVTVHQRLDELLKSSWRNSSGHEMTIDLAAIDGNAWTEEVWLWARRHPASKLIMVRGANSDQAPLIARVKRERNPKTGKLLKYSSRFYNIGVSSLKLWLYRNLAKTDPLERGYVGLPKGLDDDFFQQLTAERRVPHKRRDGHVDYRWEKDPQQANEMLDTHLQAEAAAIKLGVRHLPDATWERLEAERSVPPPQAQLDLEDRPIAPAAKPVRKQPHRRRGVISRGI